MNRSKNIAKEAHRGTKFKTYKVGKQVSYRVDTEISEEGVVQGTTPGVGAGIEGFGRAERMRDRGRAIDGGSCAYPDLNTAEVCGIASGGLPEREECNMGSEALWAQAKL